MSDNVVWVTYDELADRLGIERESARQQVKRKKWGRRPGNDGNKTIETHARCARRVCLSHLCAP